MKRLELVHEGDDIELKYFEDETDRYRSWKLSKYLINSLIPWWNNIGKKTQSLRVPLIETTEFYEFKIYDFRKIYIKEFGKCKRDYDIPIVLIEALSEMEKEGITSKKI